MNNLPVLVLSALSIMWLLLEFQRRRWPRVVVGSAVVAMQLLFGMIVLDSVGRNIQMIDAQQNFMWQATKELESGNHDLVLRAMRRMNDTLKTPEGTAQFFHVLNRIKDEDKALLRK